MYNHLLIRVTSLFVLRRGAAKLPKQDLSAKDSIGANNQPPTLCTD